MYINNDYTMERKMSLIDLTIDTVNLVDIRGRAATGVCQPFIVSCDDGCRYYVKGPKMVGYTAICSELIASRIALEWNLPIPMCKFIKVSDELLKFSARDDISELNSNILWGVEEVPFAMDYADFIRKDVNEELRRKIILFDWFVKNEDRKTGNSNLLWQVVTKKLFVIDHNNAFDEQFDKCTFWEDHVFKDEKYVILSADFYRQFIELMQNAHDNLDKYFELLPFEWVNDELIDSYRQRVKSYLSEPFEQPEQFWSGI